MLELTASAKAALTSSVQRSTPRLVIETKTGVRATVGTDGMLSGSLAVSNQCSEGSDIALGSAYIGELEVTLLPKAVESINRAAMQGAKVTAFVAYADMDIQLGVYTVDEAEWSKSGVSLTCYDNMSKTTGAYTGGELDGQAYDLLSFACRTCGVELGMTFAEVSQFPNAREEIRVYGNADIAEWRDFIGWVAQTLCAFATIDNLGRLVIRRYGVSSVDTLDSRRRSSSSSFSAFATRYTGISYVNIDDQTTVYTGLPQDDGLTMNLGQNPFLQYGLEAKKKRMATAILATLAEGAWVPFEVELPYIPPVYELGDSVTFTGRFAGEKSTSCIMGYEWTSHDGLRLRGYGSDPALATANSKTDKDISGLLSRVGKDAVQYYPFVNTRAYTIGSRVAVLEIDYASTEDGTVEFHANIDLEAIGDVESGADYAIYHRTRLMVEYELNGEILEYQPTDSYHDGWHILHLFRPISTIEGQFNELRVILTAEDGVINVGIGGIRAMVSGRGLAANDGAWRSTQSFFDEFSLSLVGDLGVSFAESASAETDIPQTSGISESFGFSLMGSLQVGFSESIGGADYTMTNGNATLSDGITYANGTFTASADGSITTDALGTDATVRGIASLSCVASGGVTIECDFGGGWMQWSGTAWAASTGGNSPEDISALTPAQWAAGYVDALTVRVNMKTGASVYSLVVDYVDDWS